MNWANLPPVFGNDVARYEALKADPQIVALLQSVYPETPGEEQGLLANLLRDEYVPEHQMLPAMQEAAPILGHLATTESVPTEVDFIELQRARRQLKIIPGPYEIAAKAAGWLLWGQRGAPDRMLRGAVDPLQCYPALGVALLPSGDLLEFITKPVASADARIEVITAKDGERTGADRVLEPWPERRMVQAKMFRIYHGLVVFASRLQETS